MTNMCAEIIEITMYYDGGYSWPTSVQDEYIFEIQ